MESALPERSPSLVLLPPSPLLSNSHCRRTLLYALAKKPVYQETFLSDLSNTVQKNPYKSFLASNISSELMVWDLDDRQSRDWWSAKFPSRIIAAVLPVIHPRSSYYKIMSEAKLPFTEDIRQHEEKLITRQKEYLRSQTAPIRAFLKLPIIHVYVQEIEEIIPLEHLIGDDLISATQNFICKIGATDTFTNDLRNYLKSL